MPFNIEFDYRFDTINFFTPPVRAALEEAARIWGEIIEDEFPNFDAGQTVSVRNPQTDAVVQVTLDTEIDDLLVFVGAGSFPGNVLANAGPDGIDAAGDANWLRVASNFRGQGPTTDFEPYIGTIRFNSTANWDFSLSNPSPFQVDFLSTALHEIGHILGFSVSSTFRSFVIGDDFFGPNALTVNNGQPVPLQSETNLHVQEGFRNNSVLMDPFASPDGRVLPGDIDKALLADIGYEIAGFEKQGTSFALATDQGEVIFGRDIADALNGLGGDDIIIGAEGNDSLRGGPGDDTLVGESGTDMFFVEVGDGVTTLNDFDPGSEMIVIDPDFGFSSQEAVLDTLTRPFSNVAQLNLGQGAQVLIFDDISPTPLSSANITFGTLDGMDPPDPMPDPPPTPTPNPDPVIALLDNGNANIVLDGAINVYTDFGGDDVYTLINALGADVSVTDTGANLVYLPQGLDVTAALFLADGLQLTINGSTVTFLGAPAASTFVFGGTPLDPTAGTALSYSETANAFGTVLPAPGAAANAAPITGLIQADGSVGSMIAASALEVPVIGLPEDVN